MEQPPLRYCPRRITPVFCHRLPDTLDTLRRLGTCTQAAVQHFPLLVPARAFAMASANLFLANCYGESRF